MNYYVILGITSDANAAKIKEAYRKMAHKYHPDHSGEDSSAFLKIQEAYHILSDPVRKRKYDQTLTKLKISQHRTIDRRKQNYKIQPEPLIPNKMQKNPESVFISSSFEYYSPSLDEIMNRLFCYIAREFRKKS